MMLIEETAMVPWSHFMPEVVIGLGNLPSAMAESYIRQSAIDLAERSQALLRWVDITLQDCVSEYRIELPSCERVVSIQRFSAGGEGDRSCSVGAWFPCSAGRVRFEWPDKLFYEGSGPREASLRVRVAVAPTRDSCEVDVRFYEQLHEAVVNGALARLYRLKKTDWYDPNLAEYHRKLAEGQITAAGLERLTQGQRGPFRMRGRRVV